MDMEHSQKRHIFICTTFGLVQRTCLSHPTQAGKSKNLNKGSLLNFLVKIHTQVF
jgi:hypothetical protein